MRTLALVAAVFILFLVYWKPWEKGEVLAVVVTDARTEITVVPEDVSIYWDSDEGLLCLGPEDVPRGNETVFLVYLLRGAGMPLRSQVYRVTRLPFEVNLVPGFPGEPRLRILEGRPDGTLVAEWDGQAFSVTPGSEWAEISLEAAAGVKSLEEGTDEVSEAVRNRATMGRLALFNLGFKALDDLGCRQR